MSSIVATRAFVVCALACLAPGLPAASEPFSPPPDQVVLARAARTRDPDLARLHQLRQTLSRKPEDLAAATAYAEAAVAAGRGRSDPRYFGYARAALAPWTSLPDPPLAVRLLRVTLSQREHRFDDAAADLDAVLRLDPQHPQAHLSRAMIRLAQGRPREVAQDCAALVRLSTPLVAVSCAALAASLSGHAAAAQSALLRTLSDEATRDSTEIQAWALTRAAEIAARREDTALARSLFAAALKLSPSSPQARGEPLRAAYADFLLALGEAAAVRELLKDEGDIDALLLRLTLAEQRLAGAEAEADFKIHLEQLKARFELQRARGESLYQRDESRFLLELEQDPVRALPVAVSNWTQQREPTDARLLLQSALAAGNPGAAAPVLAWMKETGIEDPALHRLAAALGTAP